MEINYSNLMQMFILCKLAQCFFAVMNSKHSVHWKSLCLKTKPVLLSTYSQLMYCERFQIWYIKYIRTETWIHAWKDFLQFNIHLKMRWEWENEKYIPCIAILDHWPMVLKHQHTVMEFFFFFLIGGLMA